MKKRRHNTRKNKVKNQKIIALVGGKAAAKGNEFLSDRAITLVATSTKNDSINRLKRAGILTKSGSLATKYK